MYTIYCLKDPKTNEIRYIGKTAYSKSYRLAWHLYAPVNRLVCLWLYELQQQDLKPLIETIETVNSPASAESLEIFWIQHNSGKRLLNLAYNTKNGHYVHKMPRYKNSRLKKCSMKLEEYEFMIQLGYKPGPHPQN